MILKYNASMSAEKQLVDKLVYSAQNEVLVKVSDRLGKVRDRLFVGGLFTSIVSSSAILLAGEARGLQVFRAVNGMLLGVLSGNEPSMQTVDNFTSTIHGVELGAGLAMVAAGVYIESVRSKIVASGTK